MLPTCSKASRSSIIASRVPALRVPSHRPDTRVAAAVQASVGVEGRRDPSAAPPAGGPTAADGGAAEADADRPGAVRRTAHAHPALTPRRAALVHHPRHDPALAPRYRPPPLGRQIQTEQARAATGPPPHRPPGVAHGSRQRALGVPADRRRAGRARRRRRTLDGLGDLEEAWHRPRAPACRPGLGAVPAFPGRGDLGPGPVHRRPAGRHEGLRAGRDRTRHPPDPDPGRHRPSRRPVDRAAGPEPVHGPRSGRRQRQVRAARQRRHLPRRLRRGIHRGRPADRAQRRPDAPHETSGCILHLFGAIRG